jgi:hypothetical protein
MQLQDKKWSTQLFRMQNYFPLIQCNEICRKL